MRPTSIDNFKYMPQRWHNVGFAKMPSRIVSSVSPQTYRIIRAILLSKKPFLQTEIARTTGASSSQVSRVVRWLLDRYHLERLPDARYRRRNAVGVITSAISYQRSMNDALVGTIRIRAKKKDAKRVLVREGGVLCLESALEEYSDYFRGDRVCVYHDEPDELLEKLAPLEGGILPVSVYFPDIPLEGDIERKMRTTRFRTVVDLACNNQFYTAKDLLEELWGVIIE